MKEKFARIFALGMFAFFCSSALQAADITLRLGHLANEDSSWHKGCLKFAEEVKALTHGQVEVKVFPNDSLGDSMDLINGLQLGTADMVVVGDLLQSWAPKAMLPALYYSNSNMAELTKLVDGPLGEEVRKEIIEKAKIIPLTYFVRGPRNLTSNKPIKTVNDVKDLKIRVPVGALHMQFWRATGAVPMPLPFAEIFTSLQNGMIEGQENPLATIKSGRLFEVQKYVNRTEHARSVIYLTIGEKSFNKLNAEQKLAIREAAKRAQAYERKLMLAEEQKLEAELKASGMIFVDTDKSGFASKAKEAALASAKEELKPIIQKIYAR